MDHTDQSLAKAAIAKLRQGATLSVREAEALKRVEKEQEETRRWQYYRSVPQKHYREMSGRAARVLIDQQAHLGIPCAGKTVDLSAVLKWIHDFLADNRHRLNPDRDTSSSGSKALERYRLAMAEREELAVAEIRGLLMRTDVRAIVGMCASRLVGCLNILESTLSAEFAIWMIDPKVQAMDSDDRARLVREFIARTCWAVRQAEADGVDALLDAARRDSADDRSTGPVQNTSTSGAEPNARQELAQKNANTDL